MGNEKIGFKDKLGRDLREGQYVKTYDSKGKLWIGYIKPVNPEKIIKSKLVEEGKIQYCLKTNYETWINNQDYASKLIIIEE